jgi:hypothetical protein
MGEEAGMGFFSEFKRGYEGDERRHYRVAGVQVRCPQCGGEEFEESKALLNTAGSTFLGLDWADQSAHLLVCVACTNISWFLDPPERF